MKKCPDCGSRNIKYIGEKDFNFGLRNGAEKWVYSRSVGSSESSSGEMYDVYYCHSCAEKESEEAEKEFKEKKAKEQELERFLLQANTFSCPSCNSKYDRRKQDYCTNCGIDVKKQHSCNCGHSWDAGEKFCPRCGGKKKY